MAFGIKYRVEFKDRQAILWRTDILEDGFVGSVTELKAWGNNPLKMRFRASSIKLKHSPICPKDVELMLDSETDYALMEFAYSSSKHYKMIIYEDTTNIRFEGFILKGLGGESYTNPPYPVKLQATDGLAQLKDVSYTHIGGDNVVKGSEVLTHIAVDLMNLPKEFLDNSALFPDSITPGANDTSLDSTYVNQALFIQEEMSAYDVLSDLMTTHNCRFYQSNDFWVVENLETLNTGASQTANRFSKFSYTFLSTVINNTPLSIHTDNKPFRTAGLSFIEAPKEIEVNTKLVEFDNILENDGLDNWTTLSNWTELGGGTMAEASGGQGYAAQDSFNTQTINGDPVLGIGLGITNSSYILSATGLTHDITAIVDAGGNIYNLTFTETNIGAPNWTLLDFLTIEGHGNYEITTVPSVPAGGTSTMSIRIKDNDTTPKLGARIIGKWNGLFGLEQTLEIPSTQIAKELAKDSTKILELEVEYASQIAGATAYNLTPDKSLYFIGVKAGGNNGDTFNSETGTWGNQANNGVNTTITQFIQLEPTEHNQFTTKTIEIPLDWSISGSQFIRVALIGGYATPMVYKSIKFRIKEIEEKTHTEANVADNNTTFKLEGTLFKAQITGNNTEFGAMGGVLDVNGDEHLNFDTLKTKNDVIAELIKAGYDDNVQMWRGKLNEFVDSNHIIKDPKNFDRTFQIQEITNNINKGDTNVTIVEIDPDGLIAAIFTIEKGAGSLTFAPHSSSTTSSNTLVILNTGNIGFFVGIFSDGPHFKGTPEYILAGSNKTMTVVSSKDTAGIKNEIITFEEVHGNSNSIIIPVANVVYNDDDTFYINENVAIIDLISRYEFEADSVGNAIVEVVSVHGSTITVDAIVPPPITITTSQEIILAFATETFEFRSNASQLGTLIESITFSDVANSKVNSFYQARIVIRGGISMPNTEPGGLPITTNRVRVNGGAWTNANPGSFNPFKDFEDGDTIEWNVATSFDITATTLTMEAKNRGGSTFKSQSGSSSNFNQTMTIATGSNPPGWNQVSIDLNITDT